MANFDELESALLLRNQQQIQLKRRRETMLSDIIEAANSSAMHFDGAVEKTGDALLSDGVKVKVSFAPRSGLAAIERTIRIENSPSGFTLNIDGDSSEEFTRTVEGVDALFDLLMPAAE